MREQRSDTPVTAQGLAGDERASRSLRARLAAHAMHARHDSRNVTGNARAAFLSRFDREVDPNGLLDPLERARRAAHARSAYFARLSLEAAKARRARRQQAGGDAS